MCYSIILVDATKNISPKCYRIIEYYIIYHSECVLFLFLFRLKPVNEAHNIWLRIHLGANCKRIGHVCVSVCLHLLNRNEHSKSTMAWKTKGKKIYNNKKRRGPTIESSSKRKENNQINQIDRNECERERAENYINNGSKSTDTNRRRRQHRSRRRHHRSLFKMKEQVATVSMRSNRHNTTEIRPANSLYYQYYQFSFVRMVLLVIFGFLVCFWDSLMCNDYNHLCHHFSRFTFTESINICVCVCVIHIVYYVCAR